MVQICKDELALFNQFFGGGENECGYNFYLFISLYLESLALPLSLRLRPSILQTHRIDVLSELSRSLDVLLDSPDALGKVGIEPILYDAQTRLAFRAEALINSQITNFTLNEKELLLFARENKSYTSLTFSATSAGYCRSRSIRCFKRNE